ncbi:uncharacterized protein CEXT_714041 [Caerostris extrusa]|uniref:Uncharacterized protein n=1 Tax=Caerostris extrusa TaxID=172846 RepID=A0AAV4N3D0_CAEEX|nr:uncharacterized protein CEXT_714041 [Caerostris extrusa]
MVKTDGGDLEEPADVHCRLRRTENSNEYGTSAALKDVCVDNTNTQPTLSRWSMCWHFTKSLRIEPVMFLFMFSYILNTTCLTNMIMDKGCLFYYNYSIKICDNLSANRNESDSVEVLANNYNLYMNLLAPIGALVVIFPCAME